MSSIVAHWGEPARDPEIVLRMLEASPHRGSEREVVESDRLVVGCSNHPGRKWASVGTFDKWTCALLGPVDNIEELREARGAAGSPAEVVAAACARNGIAALDRLRGAFALIVGTSERLILHRDHIGGRSLFYRSDGGSGWAASEAKQVAAGAAIPRTPDAEALRLGFYRGIDRRVSISGVLRVLYGEVVELTEKAAPTSRRLWQPEEILETADLTLEEAVEGLREALRVSISRTVSGSDAIALSGGIDSSTVAAFAAPEHIRRSGDSLRAYTAVYPRHPSVDESRYTREVAEFLGVPLVEYEIAVDSLHETERWVDLADGPWDSLPVGVAMQGYQLASDGGASQILTGTLAEYVYTINSFLLGHLALQGRIGALRHHLAMRREAGRSRRSLVKQLIRETLPAPLGIGWAALMRRRSTFVPVWIDPVAAGAPRYSTTLRDPARARWSTLTLNSTRGTTSTQEAIEAAAASIGVVVRHPLADRDLWDFFLSLPAETKFPDLIPKGLVRRAMRGLLPDSILDRRDKTVFDEHVLDSVPWERLIELLGSSDFRMPGVDYPLLLSRIRERRMGPTEVVWAYDLARVHAFVDSFS